MGVACAVAVWCSVATEDRGRQWYKGVRERHRYMEYRGLPLGRM